MNYRLKTYKEKSANRRSLAQTLGTLWSFVRHEKGTLALALVATLANAVLVLAAPMLISHIVDAYIVPGQFSGVLGLAAILLAMYAGAAGASYLQTMLMGTMGQRVLFALRGTVFATLQSLPVAFFNQNKTGDLISRINNDTEKMNQFLSSALVQFAGNFFLIVGAGIFILVLNPKLGAAAIVPAVFLLVVTLFVSPYIRRKNAVRMETTGNLSAEIQESVNNFKVVVAFNRRDYFRTKFQEANEKSYRASVASGIANSSILAPMYTFVGTAAQLTVLVYGIFLITGGQFTIGLLIGFLAYIVQFYNPLNYMAMLWSEFQSGIAAWDRISDILDLSTDLKTVPETSTVSSPALLAFDHVSFAYPEGHEVLRDVSLQLERGKTYALVGPTGGGKTTTASLLARLYDPSQGTVYLDGRDIRSYESHERAQKIGFILQEPFLFAGTVRENIVYGHEKYQGYSADELATVLLEFGLEKLLDRFDNGLETPVETGESMSLGQRQLIAFMRAVLRRPDVLILDEATANVDTVTEQLLEDILAKLPTETTKVIIAHRLNTIENADEIFFVQNASVISAGSFDDAVRMLMEGERKS